MPCNETSSAETAPRLEIRDARLGFRLGPPSVIGELEHYRGIRPIPSFPEARADIETKTMIVWDLPKLCASIRRPGGYDVLNCSCGDGGHAGLWSPIFISHPDNDSVNWEIDISDCYPALDERWRDQTGFLRLHFRRADYEADIRTMLRTMVSVGQSTPPAKEDDPDRDDEDPDELAWEVLLQLAVADDWLRQPVFPPGSVLEFRPDQSAVLLDGKPLREYVPRLFTRWTVIQAYNHWTRLYWHDGRLRIDNPAACDAAGREFVARLQASYAEGQTAPGVTIIYRSTDDQ